MDLKGTFLYDDKIATQMNFYLSKQIIETKDDYFYLGQYSYKGYFYALGKQVMRPVLKQGLDEISVRDQELIYSSVTWLNNESTKFSRQVYNIFDLLGDLGGVTEVIMLTFGFFLFSISEHSFHMTAIKKLFYARTSDEGIFVTRKTGRVRYLDWDLIPEGTPKEIKSELRKHRYIDVKNIDWIIRLYFARVLGCFCPILKRCRAESVNFAVKPLITYLNASRHQRPSPFLLQY
jgi:hypothetical protein